MSPNDLQPRSLDTDAVFSGSLKYSNAGPPSKNNSPDSPTAHSDPSSATTCTRVHGLPTEPGWASHSSGPIVVPPNPSVPPQYSWIMGPNHFIMRCLTSTGHGAAAWITHSRLE